jgi:hypothetical protein
LIWCSIGHNIHILKINLPSYGISGSGCMGSNSFDHINVSVLCLLCIIKNVELRSLAVKVANLHVAELDFNNLKRKIDKNKEKIEQANFRDSESEKELEEFLEEISVLVNKTKPEAFLLFEDFLEMLDEYEWADKRNKGQIAGIVTE